MAYIVYNAWCRVVYNSRGRQDSQNNITESQTEEAYNDKNLSNKVFRINLEEDLENIEFNRLPDSTETNEGSKHLAKGVNGQFHSLKSEIKKNMELYKQNEMFLNKHKNHKVNSDKALIRTTEDKQSHQDGLNKCHVTLLNKISEVNSLKTCIEKKIDDFTQDFEELRRDAKNVLIHKAKYDELERIRKENQETYECLLQDKQCHIESLKQELADQIERFQNEKLKHDSEIQTINEIKNQELEMVIKENQSQFQKVLQDKMCKIQLQQEELAKQNDVNQRIQNDYKNKLQDKNSEVLSLKKELEKQAEFIQNQKQKFSAEILELRNANVKLQQDNKKYDFQVVTLKNDLATKVKLIESQKIKSDGEILALHKGKEELEQHNKKTQIDFESKLQDKDRDIRLLETKLAKLMERFQNEKLKDTAENFAISKTKEILEIVNEDIKGKYENRNKEIYMLKEELSKQIELFQNEKLKKHAEFLAMSQAKDEVNQQCKSIYESAVQDIVNEVHCLKQQLNIHIEDFATTKFTKN